MVSLDLLDPLERGVLLGRLALLASQDAPAALVLLGQWERKASQERKGPQGQLDVMGNWDQEGFQGLQDLLGLQGRMETRERQEDQARRVAKETKEKLDPQGLLEFKDLWDNQDCLVQMVIQVLVGSRV